MFWLIKHLNTAALSESGTPNHIRLIGPFATELEAADWGRDNNPNDNPWWHVAALGMEPLAAISVVAPTSAPAPTPMTQAEPTP